MKRVFIDTDVLIDLLSEREPFYSDAAIIFSYANKGEIKAHVSSLCFSNIHYIISKLKSKNESIKLLRKLRLLVKILSVTKDIIDTALNSDFKDFEDGIQHYTAGNNNIDLIITGNVADYKTANLPVMTPKGFLHSLNT